MVTSQVFSAYGRLLDMVTSFQYLRWVILAADDNWTTVVSNFLWAKAVWKRMKIIPIGEGGKPHVSVLFFKAVVQALLLFRFET